MRRGTPGPRDQFLNSARVRCRRTRALLAVLDFRGRSVTFTAMLLILVLPSQLFMIPLYVLVVRIYGLGDSYLGLILPFTVNATVVFTFRQCSCPASCSTRPAGAAGYHHRDDRHLHRAME